jgi:hypothetical protein
MGHLSFFVGIHDIFYFSDFFGRETLMHIGLVPLLVYIL